MVYRKKTGRCNLAGKSFGELIAYFITRGDKDYFVLNTHGDGGLIGSDGI